MYICAKAIKIQFQSPILVVLGCQLDYDVGLS